MNHPMTEKNEKKSVFTAAILTLKDKNEFEITSFGRESGEQMFSA